MARVITYTRVSSEEQTRGASLGDQAARIQQWLDDNGHLLIAAYSEHGSGGSTEQRPEFTRMMAEVEALRPEILMVDSADRFTRNAADGGEYTNKLNKLKVRLAVIEHDEGRLLDMKVHADRAWVINAFLIADAERERMSQRQLKRYARATTKVNRPPWGVILAPGDRSRRRLVPDTDKVPIVAEIDRRALAGEGMPKIVDWLREVAPGSFNAPTSLRRMLRDKSRSYVIAGVRSAETQARLSEMFQSRRHLYGRDRKIQSANHDPVAQLMPEVSGEAPPFRPPLRDHTFAGLVACGRCVAAGRDASKSLMSGYYRTAESNAKSPFALSCIGMRGQRRVHARWSVSVAQVLPLLNDKLNKLRDDAVADTVLERWATEPVRPGAATERDALERQLAAIDEEEAALEGQVASAFRLSSSDKAALRAEAERQIERGHANRLALSAKRASMTSRLADLPAPRLRRLEGTDRDELRVNAEALLTGYQIDDSGSQWIEIEVRDVLAKWVRLIGPPILYRDGAGSHDRPCIEWPFLDAVRPEPAPDYVTP